MLRWSTAEPHDNQAWNCRGLGLALAVRTFADGVRSHDPLLIFLAETKTGEEGLRGFETNLSIHRVSQDLAMEEAEVWL